MSNHGTEKINVTVLTEFLERKRADEKAVIAAAREVLKAEVDEIEGWRPVNLALGRLQRAIDKLDGKS